MMDDVQFEVIDWDETLRLFSGFFFGFLGPHACIAQALHLPPFCFVHYLEFHDLMEVAVDGQIGNFVRHTLSETRITHPHTIRRNVQLLRALDDGLGV